MNLREAKIYLRRGDLTKIADTYKYSKQTITNVIQLKRKNLAVETAIIQLAKKRKAELEKKLNMITK